MGYTKKTLQELDLIDNFLSNAIASNRELNEPFYRLLLSVLLGKELKTVRVLAQHISPAESPELRGIRMDVEITEMEYDDGLQFIYFNTKGKKGGSQGIKNMLRYIQNSDSKNAVDDATREIDSYVRKVKNLPEVETG